MEATVMYKEVVVKVLTFTHYSFIQNKFLYTSSSDFELIKAEKPQSQCYVFEESEGREKQFGRRERHTRTRFFFSFIE